MAAKNPTDRVVDEITAGKHDGRIEDIMRAIVDRATSGVVRFPWRMRFEGDEWTQQTVTLGELRFAEQHCHITEELGRGQTRQRRATFREIDPRTTAEHAAVLLVAHLHKAQGAPLEEAMKKAEAVTADEYGEMVDEYEAPGRPKAGAGSSPSTTS